jgi:dTDP-4-amino-4,6-dideoxygalactose transaminase
MQVWMGAPISLSGADVAPEDAGLVLDVLTSPVLSGGRMLAAFEQLWAERLGCRHAVAVSSGTAALHLAIIAADVAADDLVITTPFSFVASSNVILYERGIPVFVDVEPDALTIDPDLTAEAADDLARGGPGAQRWLPPAVRDARAGHRLKALLPVHVFGRPAAMDALLATAGRHDVPVIEDACEAIMARSGNRFVGSIGRAGAFGFYPNKLMTTGEGGMLTTNDDTWAAVARSAANQGRDRHTAWLAHDRLGYNYRLDELRAALGLGQLRRIDELIERRARVAAMYAERLRHCDWLQIPDAGDAGRSWFVYVVRVRGGRNRDRIIASLASAGVPSRAYFPPIHLQPYYRERFGFTDGMFPVAEQAGREALALPFHNRITENEIDFVCESLQNAG